MNIKKKIKERGFSLEQVGSLMTKKMSQQSMSALLKDGANPTVNKLAEIASIIGMSLAELVSDDDERHQFSCSGDSDFVALIKDGQTFHCAKSREELYAIVDNMRGA